MIGNERIICRRIIAEKFNNYFVSLASNLKGAFTYDVSSRGGRGFRNADGC